VPLEYSQSRSLVPGKHSCASLVPNVVGNSVGSDRYASEQELALLRQVNRDHDSVTWGDLRVFLAGVNPFEVDYRESRSESLRQLYSVAFFVVLGPFHAHVCEDEPLGVLLNLLRGEVQFKLELKFFE
jgi:hypothetical protein